jgi:hypothetical protein
VADVILNYFIQQLRSAAVGPVMWTFGVGLFVYVMSRNFALLRRERPPLELDDGEREVDRISVEWPLLRTHTFLTSRRVVQARNSWFVSKRMNKAISLDDVHSIVWRRYTNWFLLALAIFFLNSVNPAAFLLLLFGLQSKIYSVRFATPFAQMPYTRIVVTTPARWQLAAMHRFHERARDIWSRTIVEKRLATAAVGMGALVPESSAVPSPPIVESDFAWGSTLLFYVCAVMTFAIVQRMRGPHVTFDDYVFGPVYIGMVAGVAGSRRRDALWLALLAIVSLFTIKFPGTVPADGGSPLFEEYAIVVGALLLVAVASNLLGILHPLFSPFGALLWAVVPVLTATGVVVDFALFARLLLAIGWAVVIGAIDAPLWNWSAARAARVTSWRR